MQPYYYQCSHCLSNYLLNMIIEYPRYPERGNTEGMIGLVILNEIISFETEGDKSFLEWEKVSRLKD